MTPQKVQVRSSEAARRKNIATFSRGKGNTPDKTRRPGPPNQADYYDDQEEDLGRGDMQRQESADREQQIEPGQRQEEFREPHDEFIEQSRVKTRDPSQHDRKYQRDHCGHQPREER